MYSYYDQKKSLINLVSKTSNLLLNTTTDAYNWLLVTSLHFYTPSLTNNTTKLHRAHLVHLGRKVQLRLQRCIVEI